MPRPRKPIPHGTIAGNRAHYRHGVPMCEPCRQAVRDYLGNKPFKAAQHGTVSGYQRHLRTGDAVCDPCREANRLAGQRHRARLKAKGLAPDDPRHGTDSAYSNYGCKCEPCREAHNQAMRRFYAQRQTRRRAA